MEQNIDITMEKRRHASATQATAECDTKNNEQIKTTDDTLPLNSRGITQLFQTFVQRIRGQYIVDVQPRVQIASMIHKDSRSI
jgi:hypothetical protein